MIQMLRDPIWQAIGALVAIAALVVAVLQLAKSNKPGIVFLPTPLPPTIGSSPIQSTPISGEKIGQLPVVGEKLVEEHFIDLDSWQIKAYESSVWRSFLHDGEYHIEVHSATISNYYARREFADASIQVEARYIGDDGNLYFGIVSRHSRLGAYYFFVDPISHFYAFDRFGDGGWKRLQNGYLPESDARKPNSVYRLRVDMNDGNLRLYVNDHYLTQVDDYELVRGQVGLVVSASLNSRIHVAFDNLVIRSGQ